MFNFALANPLAAAQAGIITAETAAAITSGAVSPTSLAPVLNAKNMKTVATLEEAFLANPAKASPSGYVNAKNICNSGCAISDLTVDEMALVSKISSGQDGGGTLTEKLLGSVAKRTGMDVIDGGKYGSNNGFDLVLKAKDGTVTVILDGKQMTSSGAMKLSSSGAGDTTQLTNEWIRNVLRNLPSGSDARKAIIEAQEAGKLVTAVGGVNRNTGQLVVFPITFSK